MQISSVKRWLILFNVTLSVFMATLDSSIVNIALPVISKNLSVDISSVQWVVTSYLLTISVLLLIWGKIADLYGKKYVFAAGFIIFTVGSFLCGISQSLGMLVFSRVLQAFGASSMMALSQGIVTAIFPAGERGKALGITGTTVALGSLTGPSLGGILVKASGWQLIFFINIPVGIIGTILSFILIPKDMDSKREEKFDTTGTVLFVFSILLLFMGLLLYQESKLSLLVLLGTLFAALVLLFLFIRHEAAVSAPLLNLSLFKNPVFSLGLISAYMSYVSIFATLLFLPFYLQNVLGYDTLKSGLFMSFYPLASALVAPVSGWLSDKISYRPLTFSGLMLASVAYFLLSTLDEASPYLKIAILIAILGVGTALFQSPNNNSVMGSVPRERLGVAGGINALFRNLGMVSGITLSVSLFSMVTKMNINSLSGSASVDTVLFLKGFKVVLITASAVSFAAAMICLYRNRIRQQAD